jgi:hypothetical protein
MVESYLEKIILCKDDPAHTRLRRAESPVDDTAQGPQLSVGLSIMPGEYVRRSRRWAERRYTTFRHIGERARSQEEAV